MAGAPKGNSNAKGNKGGAPKGNSNAKGNKGGAPEGNLNALSNGSYYDPTKHLEKDFLKKYLPTATKKIIKEAAESGINSLEILWTNIQLQFAAIIRSQKIMYVKDINDKTIEKIEERGGKTWGEKWEVQQSWDKQSNFLTSQSKAMSTLINMISKYDELLHKNWELASEEQRTRVDILKAQLNSLSGDKDKNKNVKKLDSILSQIKSETNE